MARREELTNEQWAVIEPFMPDPPCRADGRGRPWRDSRAVMNGILWILRSGARWKDLRIALRHTRLVIVDSSSGSEMACSSGCLMVLAVDLRERGELDLTECFIDGTFVAAKKGVSTWEYLSGAKV